MVVGIRGRVGQPAHLQRGGHVERERRGRKRGGQAALLPRSAFVHDDLHALLGRRRRSYLAAALTATATRIATGLFAQNFLMESFVNLR